MVFFPCRNKLLMCKHFIKLYTLSLFEVPVCLTFLFHCVWNVSLLPFFSSVMIPLCHVLSFFISVVVMFNSLGALFIISSWLFLWYFFLFQSFGYRASRWYSIFFVLYVLIGVYFVTNLILAVVYDSFKSEVHCQFVFIFALITVKTGERQIIFCSILFIFVLWYMISYYLNLASNDYRKKERN